MGIIITHAHVPHALADGERRGGDVTVATLVAWLYVQEEVQV